MSAAIALLASSSGDSGGWLLLIGPAGAGALYFGLWQYYRNAGKSHSFERETRVATKPITGNDRKVDEVRGTKKSGIDNANHSDHRERVQRFQ